MKITLQERFEKFVEITPGGCHIWRGACQGTYPVISVGGKLKLAHRIAMEIYGDGTPDDMCVRHKCKQKRCVNVDHLQVGTLAQNQADRIRDGTASRKRLWEKPQNLIQEIQTPGI